MLKLDFKSKFQCVYVYIYSHSCLKEKLFSVNLFLHFKEWIYTKHVRISVSSSRICLSGLHVSWSSMKNNNKPYFSPHNLYVHLIYYGGIYTIDYMCLFCFTVNAVKVLAYSSQFWVILRSFRLRSDSEIPKLR